MEKTTEKWYQELKYMCPYDEKIHTYSAECNYEMVVLGLAKSENKKMQIKRLVNCPLNGKPFKATFTVEVPSGMNVENIEVGSETYSLKDETYLGVGKKALENSAGVINTFANLMITLNTTMFTAYFALFKFLGFETIAAFTKISFIAVIAPFFFILSIASFVLVHTPRLDKIHFDEPSTIENSLNKMIEKKRKIALTGVGLFITGLSAILVIISVFIL